MKYVYPLLHCLYEKASSDLLKIILIKDKVMVKRTNLWNRCRKIAKKSAKNKEDDLFIESMVCLFDIVKCNCIIQ